MNPWQIVLIVLAVMIILWLIISYFCFKFGFYYDNKEDVTFSTLEGKAYEPFQERSHALIKKATEIPYEEVYIKSYDGLKLFAKLYLKDKSAPICIQCHGYKGCGIRDFSGGLQIALNAGMNALVIDHRAHGKSEGHVITFGIKERKDVLSWIDYVNERLNNPKIFLQGISMGAATVLMTLNEKLPDNVVGVVCDCPYSSPKEIIQKVTSDMHIPAKPSYPFVYTGALLYGHFNLSEATALNGVKKTNLPIFLVHGSGDFFVPPQMSRRLKEANPNIEYHEVEGAPHGYSYFVDETIYFEKVVDFMKRCL